MICPKCRAEYQENQESCTDCGVLLVKELPGHPTPPAGKLDLVELLATYNPGDVAILRSVLDANGVEYFLHGENFAIVQPLVEPTRLLVRRDQAQMVQNLLQGLDLNFLALATDSQPEDDGLGDQDDADDPDDKP